MNDLIRALQIFAKYKNLRRPVYCEHDELMILGITYDDVSEEDRAELEKLSFSWSDSCDGYWYSFRFGSA